MRRGDGKERGLAQIITTRRGKQFGDARGSSNSTQVKIGTPANRSERAKKRQHRFLFRWLELFKRIGHVLGFAAVARDGVQKRE